MRSKYLLLSIALAAGASSVFGSVPTCVNGDTLAQYETLYGSTGCQVDNMVFSNFNFTSSAEGGAAQILASGVTVDTIGPDGSEGVPGPDVGLQFNANFTATGSGQVSDGAVSFTDQLINMTGPVMITDAGLAQISGVTGNATASVAEKGCGPAPCTPGLWGVLTFDDGTPDSLTVSDTMFAPQGSIQVIKDIGVESNSPGSFATLSVVQDTFSVSGVPEPASVGTAFMGLAGLLLLSGRRWRQRRS